jgi:hypothetical protein
MAGDRLSAEYAFREFLQHFDGAYCCATSAKADGALSLRQYSSTSFPASLKTLRKDFSTCHKMAENGQ